MDRDTINKKSETKNQKSNVRNSKNFKSVIFNSRAGFTLIEVLIALTILSVGLLGVALMQVTSISGTTFSREMNVATGLAQDMLEKLRTLTYTDTTTDPALTAGATHPVAADVSRDLDGDTQPPFLAVALGNANVIDERGLTLGPTLYTRTWSITDNTPASDMKTIAVTVSWTERGAVSTTRSVTITGIKVQS
jgi:type IV pilus assembly protein PilV